MEQSNSKMWYWVGGIVVVLLVLYFAFGGGSPSISGATVRIGVILPLTGEAGSYGEPMNKVLQVAVKEINDAGGIANRPIELIVEDGKCNGRDAASAMQKLATVDNVVVVIGGFCSSESLAAEPIATQNKILLLSGGSSSPDLTGKSKYFARNYPSDASQGGVLAEIAYSDKGWRKVAFIQEQLDYPLGIYKAFGSTFEGLGGKIIKEEFPTETTVDFRSSLTRLRGENPDALFVDTQTPAAADRVLRQLKELGWTVNVLITDTLAGDPATVANNAAVLEGALAAEFGIDSSNAKLQHLIEAYRAAYSEEVPFQSYAQTMYDAVYILRDAIEAVGDNGVKIAEWVRNLESWEGASGMTTIDDNGDRVGGHTAKIIKGGKVEFYTQ